MSNLTLTIRTPRDIPVRLELPGGLTAVEISATANELNARDAFGIVYDRAGAALAPLHDSLGSFGLRNSLVNAAGSQTIAAAPRFVNLSIIPPEVIPAPVPFQFPITYPRAAANAVGAIIPAPDRAMRTPWAETYSASWQRQWTSSWSTELGWDARRGQRLLSLVDAARKHRPPRRVGPWRQDAPSPP